MRAIDPGHELAMGLRAAYWAMHRRTAACFQPLAVTANQFVLLSLLSGRRGMTQQELVGRASSDANTVRAMLVVLEGKGLIDRRPHPRDGRARLVTLTTAGRRTRDMLRDRSRPVRKRLLSAFRPGEVALLIELLGRVSRRLATPLSDRPPATRTKP